ncbi:MAG: hypothetical protein R3E97_18810 [Candidatus Eisenbacteria bacterium]
MNRPSRAREADLARHVIIPSASVPTRSGVGGVFAASARSPHTRFLLCSLFLCALVVGWADFASAQAQGQQDPDDRPDPAPADTSRFPSLFDRIGIHPELDARFDVNRSATTYGQGANIRRHFGPTLLTSDWGVSVQSNAKQNDRRSVSGNGTTRVARHGAGGDGWKFGTEFGVDRRAVTTTYSRNVINSTGFDLVGESGFLGAAMREQLELEQETLEWRMDGKFGAVHDENVNERRSRTNPAELETADSTAAGGTNWALNSEFGLTPLDHWRIDIAGAVERGDQDRDTILRPNPDSTFVQSGVNQNRSRDLDVSMKWSPSKRNEIRFDADWTVTRNQYYSTTEKDQEVTNGNKRNLGVSVTAEPFWGIKTNLGATTGTTANWFTLAVSGASKEQTSFDGTVSWEFGRPFGWLEGIEAKIEGNTGSTTTKYQDVTAGFVEDVVYIKGLLTRSWKRGTEATLSATGDLSQKYYEQPETGALQDQDRLKQRVDFGLKYQLAPKVETLLTVNWSKSRTINIVSERAAANVDETSISTRGQYIWTLWRDTKLTQEVVVSAISSTRPYNEDESSLRRTTQLTSEVESLLWSKARVRLQHEFEFQDQGAFLINQRTGLREFFKDTEVLNQEAETEVTYTALQNLDFFYRQKFYVRGSEKLLTGAITKKRTTEIRWGGRLRHNVDEDFYVDIGFDRISSTVEPSYWIGEPGSPGSSDEGCDGNRLATAGSRWIDARRSDVPNRTRAPCVSQPRLVRDLRHPDSRGAGGADRAVHHAGRSGVGRAGESRGDARGEGDHELRAISV